MSESQRKIDPVVAEQMFRDGKTEREIADHFGASVKRVGEYRRRFGIFPPTNAPANLKIDPGQLAKLVAEGHTNAFMADHFKVQRHSLVEARRRIGLPSNEPSARPKYDYERIVALTKDGYSAAEIARELGCSKETVRRTRTKFGVSQGPTLRKYPQETRDRALSMLEDGASYHEVARTLGMPDTWLRKHFPGMGWTPEQLYEYRAMKKQLDSLFPDV